MSCLTFRTSAQNGTLVYGDGYSYLLIAPEHWVSDPDAARDEGLSVVFHKDSESWADGETVMYGEFYSFHAQGENIDSAIQGDIRKFASYADINIRENDSVLLTGGKYARILAFLGGAYKNYEEVAYIAAPGGVILLVITSVSQAGLDDNIPVFNALLKSFLLFPSGDN